MEEVKVSNIIEDQKTIHVVLKNANIKEVLETFYKHNVISLPVMDFEGKCLGLVDVVDVLSFLLRVTSQPQESNVTPTSTSLKDDDLDMLLARSNEFNLSSVEESLIINLSKRNPFLPCTRGAPLQNVLQVFSQGVHRIPVVTADAPNSIVNILTQSDVNSFLATDIERFLGDKQYKTVEELGLIQGADKVVCVSDDVRAIDAFFQMHDARLSDVGVVNENGALQGCLSATDLKGIKDFSFRVLLRPVMTFVRETHATRERPRNYLVHCNKSATLGEIVSRLAAERVHRIFIVEDGLKPVGVISLTDIANILLN